MAEMKALPSPPSFLTLPDYTGNLSDHFVEPSVVNQLVDELSELVAKHIAEMRSPETDASLNECRKRIFRLSVDERSKPFNFAWKHYVEGASLVVNPLPIRKRRYRYTDADLLRSDWLCAFADADKVWNTVEYCVPLTIKKSSDVDATRKFGPRREARPKRQTTP